MHLRTVGQRKWPINEIVIQRTRGGVRDQKGRWRPTWIEPYLPEKITDPYHPSGNSLCYMIQTAHLMGCDPIYALGFTLETGGRYFFGDRNPVTRKPPIYDQDRALAWISWYQSRYPGRVRLWPDWSGPVYDVLEAVTDDEAKALFGAGSRHEPDPSSSDVPAVE